MGKLNDFGKAVMNGAKTHAPELLVASEIACGFGAVIFAIYGTVKAVKKVESKKQELGRDLTKKEIVKETWTCYIPAAVSETVSVASAIGAHKVNATRTATLAAAYTLSDQAFKEYRSKVVETIGEKKDHEIHTAVSQDKLDKDPITNKKVTIYNGGNGILWYDSLTKEYFEMSKEELRGRILTLTSKIYRETFVSINEWCDIMDFKHMDKALSGVGWNTDDLPYFEMRDPDDLGPCDIDPGIANDGRPCLVLTWNVGPKSDYMNLV